MGFTVRELMNVIERAIENHNEFLDAQIILGNDEELNGAHLCLGFQFLNERDKRDFNDLDLGVELDEDKHYILLA